MEEPLDLKTLLKQKDEIISYLKLLLNDKDKIIKLYEEKIKDLEMKLEKFSKINKEFMAKEEKNTVTPGNNYLNDFSEFNIQKKIPLIKVEPNNGCIYTMKKLNDDRIACGFSNGNIIVFSKEKYEKEIELNDYHKGGHITFLTQLKNGIFISCGSEGKINFFKILENQCSLFQTIKAHEQRAMKLRELEFNNLLVSCSEDKTLNFYIFQNEYKIEQKITTNIDIWNLIETKNGKIVLTGNVDKIQFFDINTRKLENQISGIKLYRSLSNNLINLSDTLLAVGGTDDIFIINVLTQQKVNEIKIPGSNCITCFCKLNDTFLLTGDCSNSIRQWKISGEFLIQEYLKEKSHGDQIRMIEKYENGLIVTCSDDGSLKIW